MLINIYILGLILKEKITTIILLKKIGPQWFIRTGLFPVFDSQKSKDWTAKRLDCSPGPVQSWSLKGPRTGPSNTSF